MGLTPHEVAGVGDAENDHAFISQCECGVAVANALVAVKEHADYVTRGDHGSGVSQLIGDRAEVIAAVDHSATRDSVPLRSTGRVKVVAAKVDGRWKIAELALL
jgi:3-deoxy-D-manno-octulosonate 8-phosphate phosphatase KdsC-like HAD superfamily phosphatase